jgi:pimeloyl-ACP methyl ester carboxylesterase
VGPAGRRGRRLCLGRGEAIVLLASPLARGECYLPPGRRLAKRGRVHLLEMPGSGQGQRLASPWSLADYAAWSAGAIAECGLGRPAVIGHSYSGMVAVALAARHPERVGTLVVAGAPGAGAPASLGQAIRGAGLDLVLDLGLVALLWPCVAANLLTHRRNFLALLREALHADVTALARRVRAPALVAWGAREHTLPPEAAQVYAATLPDARAYVSPRGTHTWVISQPEEFARAVASFLATCGH